jgi:protocatechuate 3,4-dioxygenase beta subunit
MGRSGGFLTLLLIALAIFGAVYLVLGDSILGGTAARGYSAVADVDAAAGSLSAGAAELEASGRRPKTAEERAAEAAAAAAAAAKVKTFPPEHGIFGTVTDGKGRVMQGAVISLVPDPPEDRFRRGMPDRDKIATTMSKADGAYLVGPAPEDMPMKVRAEAQGFAPTIRRVRQRGARVDLILDRGGTLEVRVLDPDGTSLAGADVQHQAGDVITAAQTDASGVAHFASLPTGTGSLIVTKQGYGAVRDGNVAVAPGETEEMTLVLTKGFEVAGTVTEAETERPVEGAVVTLRYQNLPGIEAEGPVTTGEDGRFRLTAHVSGNEQMIVRAHKEGFGEGRVWRNAATRGEIAIKLQAPGEAISGRVTDHQRQPVGGVELTYANQLLEAPDEIPKTTSAEDGSFTLPLPAWANPGWNLLVLAHAPTEGIGVATVSVAKPDGPPAKPVEIELSGSGAVTGIVKDAGGQPIQGAAVGLGPDWNAAQGRPGRKPVPWQLLQTINNGVHTNLATVTGADGRYRIVDVPAMGYKVTASFGLEQYTPPDVVTVEAGETAEQDIALGEGGKVEGWVLDGEEEPIAGAYVHARPTQRQGYNWWQNQPSARSQSDGRFVLRGVTDESYTLHANASGYGSATKKNVTRGMTELTLWLTARGWIEGVVYREGEPCRGMFTVKAVPTKQAGGNQNFPGRWQRGQQTRTFNTDDGKFQLEGVEAGEYIVTVSTQDGFIAAQPEIVAVTDGRPSRRVRMDLQAGAILRGTVRNDESGRPIAQAWVYANPSAGGGEDNTRATSGHAQCDGQGRYEIKGLGAGAYAVTVWSPGGTSFSSVVDVRQGAEQHLDLTELRPGTVSVTVLDESEKPVADARVHIRSTNGNYVNVNAAAMQKEGLIGKSYNWRTLWNTDEAGLIVRYHVPPGAHQVWATRRDHEMSGEHAQVTVASGRVSDVVIKMKKK